MSCPSHLRGRSRSARSEKASERLERLPAKDLCRASGVEQLTRFAGRALPWWVCGAAGMDLLVLAALVAPPWDAEHRTPWPASEGGWWDIKAPRGLCRSVSPQACRPLGCWGSPVQGSAAAGGQVTAPGDALEQAGSEVFSGRRGRFKVLGSSALVQDSKRLRCCSLLLLLVILTRVSPPIKPFHRLVKTSCNHTLETPCQQELGSVHAARSCHPPGTGTPPAPYTCSGGLPTAQRGAANVCKQPGLPAQALSAFLSVYSSNSTTSPTKSAQRLQRAERVCCPQGTDDAFPFDLSRRKAVPGPLGVGARHRQNRGSSRPHTAAAGVPAEISSRSSHLAGLAEQV